MQLSSQVRLPLDSIVLPDPLTREVESEQLLASG